MLEKTNVLLKHREEHIIMPREIIALFSSDARELYKGDIFRVLALPHNYTIHFRYRSGYFQDDLLRGLNSLIGKEGVIFYAVGNDLTKPKEQRVITLHSIRNVIIKDIQHDPDLDLINFYLELGDFCDCKPHQATSPQLLPPYLSVSRIQVDDGPNKSWIDRVTSVNDKFDNTLFYLIRSVKHAGEKLEPKYSSEDKESFYELNDEREYQVQLSFFDPTEGQLGINIENTNELVQLIVPPGHKVGAPRDTTIFNLYTHTLPTERSIGFSRLFGHSSVPSNDLLIPLDLRVELRWHVIRGMGRILLFGFFSALAGLGLFGVSIVTKDFSNLSMGPLNVILLLISLGLIGLAAGLLYKVFNKK
jgi:hypothetical protein